MNNPFNRKDDDNTLFTDSMEHPMDDLQCYAKEMSLIDKIHRNVVIVGSSGVGKSTIVNMLYNGDFAKEACLSPAIVGNDSTGVTRNISFYISIKSEMMIIDTIGFGDSQLSEAQVIQKTQDFFNISRARMNTIVFVTKFGRVDKSDLQNLFAIDHLFQKNWRSQSVLVFTHYREDIVDTEEEKKLVIQKWLQGEKDKEISEFVNSFAKIIFTDNNTRRNEESTRPNRKRFLAELQCFVTTCNDIILSQPQSLKDVFALFFRRFFDNSKEALSGVLHLFNQPAIKSHIGICILCEEETDLETFVITDCKHTFHASCLQSSFLKKESAACPSCGTIIHNYYSYFGKSQSLGSANSNRKNPQYHGSNSTPKNTRPNYPQLVAGSKSVETTGIANSKSGANNNNNKTTSNKKNNDQNSPTKNYDGRNINCNHDNNNNNNANNTDNLPFLPSFILAWLLTINDDPTTSPSFKQNSVDDFDL